MTASATPSSNEISRESRAQLTLLLVLLGEIALFAVIGHNFFTAENAFRLLGLSVEIGLLAVALTPLVIGGGIDLSVGSLLGLSAVMLGLMYRDWHVPLPLAIAATLLLGAMCGALNGLLVTRLRLPPLIVTLGTFSLFRGLAVGITGGTDTFGHFPNWFVQLGQGSILGIVPCQLPIFVLVIAAFWMLQHRTTLGRSLVAIGYSPAGARYAGIPVRQRLMLVYVLSGLISSLAAVIYVAHVNQAKSDAGTGYELLAIAAVVLGGTSIFGGRGTVHGTVLGLLVIAVLKTGLTLSDLPSELAGIVTGILLLATVGLDGLRLKSKYITPPRATSEEFEMKNSQVAVLAAVILLGAGLIAGSNWLLFSSLRSPTAAATARSTNPSASTSPPAPIGKPLTLAMMPKSKGNGYFIACRKGAEEAAQALNVNLIWDGPTETDPAEQTKIIENWITRRVDVIAVAVENRGGISSALRKARAAGIHVVTWDSDAEPDARDFFVNQATPQGIGEALMDNAARVMHEEGEFAIIAASLTAANQNEWKEQIEIRRAAKYPNIVPAKAYACDDQQDQAFKQAKTIMAANPKIKLLMAICSPAVPGAAEAVKQTGRDDVKVVGLGLPNENKMYVKQGITDTVILWNTMDLGYLTVWSANELHAGRLKPGDKQIDAGRLGKIEIADDNILLGKPFSFTKQNIESFDF